jgi:two-component sensor histidine kinase
MQTVKTVAAQISCRDVLPRALGTLVVGLTVTVLCGWATQSDRLLTMLPGRAAMQPATAVCLLCLGLALALARPGRTLPLVAVGSAGIAAIWGCATMAEYILGVELGFDRWLFADSVARQPAPYPHPGRMAFATTIAVCLFGFSLCLITPPNGPKRRLTGSIGTSAALLIGAISMLGHVFGVTGLRTFGSQGAVAIPTAICMLATATGTLLLAPDIGWVGRLHGSGPGARTARLLLPATGVAPIAVGWILVQGSQAGLYDADFRVALFAIVNVLLLSGLLIWATQRTDTIEARRYALEQQATEQQRLLMREVDHRAKNVLAVVQSIIRLTKTGDPIDYPAALNGRIDALANAHTLLAQSGWSGVDFAALVRHELAALGGDMVSLRGPNVMVHADATQSIALVLHELTVNALRHGALSRPKGHLDIAWAIADRASGGDRTLQVVWRERSDLRLSDAPIRPGFGMQLLNQITQGQLHGTVRIDWLADGLRCTLMLPDRCFVALPEATTKGIPEEPILTTEPERREIANRHRILIVEDEALVAMVYEEYLIEVGYDIIGPAADLPSAMTLLAQERPDAAILDVNLSGKPVYPLAETLIEIGVPFVLCTGYAQLDIKTEKLRHAPVLTKPVNSKTLIAVIADLLGDRPSETGATVNVQ